MVKLVNTLRHRGFEWAEEEKGEGLSLQAGTLTLHDHTHPLQHQIEGRISDPERGPHVRFEIVKRQRFKHAVLVAQFLVAFSALGQDKPTLLVIGSPTGHAWKTVTGPAWNTRIVDRSAEPRFAEAYANFAKVVGVEGDPLYVLVTPFMEPFAASADPAFVDRAIAGREQLTAQAGLAVRKHLLSGQPVAAEEQAKPDMQLYDHIGGGFFRCAGCFDKLLADQAGAALYYLEHGRPDIVRATLDYALADLQDKSGLFVAGAAADSLVPRGKPVVVEGGYYLWNSSEVHGLLGPRTGDIVAFHYGIKETDTLPQPRPESETRARFNLTQEELTDLLNKARATLVEVRLNRPKPRWNPAVITAHNAAMISALARAAIAFGDERYGTAALRSARALKPQTLTVEEQALLTRALFDVYQVTFDPSFLLRATSLAANATADVPAPVASLAPKAKEVKVPSLDDLQKIIVAGSPSRQDTQDLLRSARKSGEFVVFVDGAGTRKRLAAIIPNVNELVTDDEPVAAACNRGICRPWAN